MAFKVISPQGNGSMRTDHWQCVPELNQLRAMQAAGFGFRIDGKGASYEQLADALYVNPKTVERAFKRRGLVRIRTRLHYYGKD